jgi:hypothetical protein
MEQIIKLHVTPSQELRTDSATLRVECTEEAPLFFSSDDFPLQLEIKDKWFDTKRWSWELFPNCYTEYFYFENKELIIRTASGKEILSYKWNPDIHGTTSQNLFDMWTKCNPDSKGVAIGSNDGTTGEWVEAYHSGRIGKILCVEASSEPFDRLVANYKDKPGILMVNALVTQFSMKDVPFFEGTIGNGVTNSLIQSFVNSYMGGDMQEVKKDSIGINELLEQTGFADLDWLHIDAEGVDELLLKSLNFDRIKKPKMIVYEHKHIQKPYELKKWFIKNGYSLIEDAYGGTGNVAILID